MMVSLVQQRCSSSGMELDERQKLRSEDCFGGSAAGETVVSESINAAKKCAVNVADDMFLLNVFSSSEPNKQQPTTPSQIDRVEHGPPSSPPPPPLIRPTIENDRVRNQTSQSTPQQAAQQLPEGTVMCAQLVGLQAWSRTRIPTFHCTYHPEKHSERLSFPVCMVLEALTTGFESLVRRYEMQHGSPYSKPCYALNSLSVDARFMALAAIDPETAQNHRGVGGNHAVVMARLAADFCDLCSTITAQLEAVLGPGTSTCLQLQIGLASGPMKQMPGANIPSKDDAEHRQQQRLLRHQRRLGVRDQNNLFLKQAGEVLRIASVVQQQRGKPGCIRATQITSNLLLQAHKGHWLAAGLSPSNHALVSHSEETISQDGCWVVPRLQGMRSMVAKSWIDHSAEHSAPPSGGDSGSLELLEIYRHYSNIAYQVNPCKILFMCTSGQPHDKGNPADDATTTTNATESLCSSSDGIPVAHSPGIGIIHASLQSSQERLIDWTVGVLSCRIRRLHRLRQQLEHDPSSGFSRRRRRWLSNRCPSYYLQTDLQTSYTDDADASSQLENAVAVSADIAPHYWKQRRQQSRRASSDQPSKPKEDSSESNLGSPPQHEDDDELQEEVLHQLREFISVIAHLHRNINCYHNFQRTTHVLLWACRLLEQATNNKKAKAGTAREHASRMSSMNTDVVVGELIVMDPLAELSLLFAVLMQNADHLGYNHHFREENAQQQKNAVEIGLQLLMDPAYANLQATMFAGFTEFARFRQLVTSIAMSTTASPGETAQRCKNAFEAVSTSEDERERLLSLQVTVLLENVLQAADVYHAMQDWTIYSNWTGYLLRERSMAFLHGGEVQSSFDGDLASTWYQQELKWFDTRVIPVGERLRRLMVLMKAGDLNSSAFLDHALANRLQWEARGAGMIQDVFLDAKILFVNR